MAATDERAAGKPAFPAGLPPGFPNCARCPYLSTGPAACCFACATDTLRLVGEHACAVCSQLLDGDGCCPNELCRDRRRRIGRIQAVAYQSGPLRQVLYDYKFRGVHGWALILGRLVLGWLAAHAGESPPDLIVANPGWPGPSRSSFLHAESVLATAAAENDGWPFAAGVIVKSGPSARSADAPADAKRAIGRELRSLLQVPDPARTAGRRILVFDDICTTGRQLDAVAGCLLDEGGAARVDGLVLARVRWAGDQSPRRR
jgi:predicted amidophosphoribosyltransferase